jgi:hypothetical protein
MPASPASEQQSETDADTGVPKPMAGYAPPGERPPLLSYGAMALLFNALFGAAVLLIRRSGRELPERMHERDVFLIGTATHKLSRLIAKERVTAVLRSPFTELRGRGGPAEFDERARGTGVRRAIGELLVCPWCVGLWIAAALSLGLVVAPRLTRFVAAVFTALTISDFLQLAYKAAEKRGR